MKKRISVFAFFSGIGMLDLAFEKNGYNIVFVNEYNSNFMEAYKYARKNLKMREPVYGYHNESAEKYLEEKEREKIIKLIEAERQKGNLVGFVGGPPCPDFSVAGKNAGENGENGRLTKTYFDLVCSFKPDFFLFENVKGLVRTEKHRTFYLKMKRKVLARKYIVDDTIANALTYGVPQFRERCFMVGIKDNIFVQHKDTLSFDWLRHSRYDIMNILSMKWPKTNPFAIDEALPFPVGKIPKKLTVEYWFKKNDVINHPNGNDVFMVKSGRDKITTIREGDTHGKSFKRLHRWRYSPTAAYGHNEIHLHPYKERRLSVAEAMAVQSLPKGFVVLPTLPLSLKFKMIGNGVPYMMAAAIAKTLKETLCEIQEDNNENCKN